MVKKKWDAAGYQQSCGFVYQYGNDVLEMLDIAQGMQVLDIGCGNGVLTQKIAEKGAIVTGIDSSADMLALARKNFPELNLRQMDATELPYREEFDAVFSNAVFHWIADQEALIRGIADCLKPEGHLVCEFGGANCAKEVHAALRRAFEKRGLVYRFPFYFPTIGEYAPRLEAQGLRVEYALLFDRPTTLKEGETAKDWIQMFVTQAFEGMEESLREEIIAEAEEELRPVLRREDGSWFIDYVRIRIKAVKV